MESMAQWKFLHHHYWGVLDVAHREVPDALCNVLHHLVADVMPSTQSTDSIQNGILLT